MCQVLKFGKGVGMRGTRMGMLELRQETGMAGTQATRWAAKGGKAGEADRSPWPLHYVQS